MGSAVKAEVEAYGPQPPSDRVRHLLTVARTEFLRRGYQQSSIEGIARAASVSKETVYRHYPDKPALFRAVMRFASAGFAQRLPDFSTPADTPERIIADCARAIYQSSVTADNFSSMRLGIAIVSRFPDLADQLHADGLQSLAPVARYIQGVAAGRGFAGRDPLDAAMRLGAMAAEGTAHVMGWPVVADIDAAGLPERVARLFLHGVTAPAESARRPIVPSASREPAPPAPLPSHIANLMAVAREDFFRNGYRGANIDEIGARARVGRGTLYRHFQSKQGLFAATMLDAAQRLAAAQTLRLDPAGDLETNLIAAAHFAADRLLSDEGLAIQRSVIEESVDFDALAREVYTALRSGLAAPLAGYLAALAQAGELVLDDADWAASQFIVLAVEGNRHFATAARVTAADRGRIARAAAATFLHGHLF